MQPYFLPYIGYFQLMQNCDVFVIYDDIKYTKRGWISRNRILADGKPRTVSLPLQRDSDFLDVRDRTVSPEYNATKTMRLFRQSYAKAPFWEPSERLLEAILGFQSRNLFGFVANSVSLIAASLELSTDIVVSSTLPVEAGLRGQERVMATCEALRATEYVNPIGGLDLYSEEAFAERGIALSFLRSRLTPYTQFGFPFVEALSIIDTMVFVAPDDLAARVRSDYEIITR
jgi:hypothetical protein